MKETKYTGYIRCYNNVGARFQFSANGIDKAMEYVESLFTGDVMGFDWDGYPGQIHYVSFKSETAKLDRYVYNKEPYSPEKCPVKSFAQCIKENFTLCRLLESLTPGGSEFANDPQRCAEWVKEQMAGWPKEIVALKAEKDKLSNLLLSYRNMVGNTGYSIQKEQATYLYNLSGEALN